jgi:hypothetical protein
MGTRHFKQMLEDAYEQDRKAMAAVNGFYSVSPLERRLYGRGFWEDKMPDAMMVVGRGLVPLGEAFLDAMKQLLVEGKVDIKVRDQNGKIRRTRNPDVIDFDEPFLTNPQFIHLMMTAPAHAEPKFCSGDQVYG